MEQYRDLADPGTPFKRAVIIRLLHELRTQHSMVDSIVSNVPHDLFDRIRWDVYYLGPDKEQHNYAGNVYYSKAGEEIATAKLKVSENDAAWSEWRSLTYKYPLEISIEVLDRKHWERSIRTCTAVGYDINNPEESTIICDLLAGFFDAALNILGREPLKVVAEEVESSVHQHAETDGVRQ